MNFVVCGSQYGGFLIDFDIIKEGSTVISAGIGEDISFDVGIIERKGCKIIGIDPTPKSHAFIESFPKLENYKLIKDALHVSDGEIIEMYKNKREDHVSESIYPTHAGVKEYDSYYSETISLPTLFRENKDISVVKMDVEGAEYDIFANLSEIPETVRQVCVEFHHFCTDKTIEDTKSIINKMKTLGFEHYIENPSGKSLAEITFWRNCK